MAELIKANDTLNQGRIKLNEAIKDADKSKIDAASALDRSLSAEQISLLAEAMAQSTQQQLDNIIIDSGTSDAEVIQARDTFPLLKDRLNNTESQLAGTTSDLDGRGYNVLSYGAVGDGLNDDTAAIQHILNLAETLGQVTVIFPPGTYKLTKKLIVYKNTHIVMSPNTILLRAHTASIIQNGPNGAEYEGYDGNGNITIEGGIIDSNIVNYDYECSGLSLSHAEGIYIKNLTIKDIYAGHAIDLSGVRNVLIENCRFIGYRDRPDNSRNYSEAIQIDVQTQGGFPAFGKHDGTVTQDVTVRNCYFGASGTTNTTSWPCAVGHHAAVHDIFPREITIQNNKFKNLTFRAIRLFKFKDVIIEGNFFIGCVGSVNISTPSANSEHTKDIEGNQMGVSQAGDSVIIRGNFFEDSDGVAATISINGVVGEFTKSIKILDNIFKNTLDTNGVIYAGYADMVDIKNNKFFNCNRVLWVQNSKKINLDGNDCDLIQNEMIFAQSSSNISIIRNKVVEVGKNGINLDSINHGLIQSNKFDKVSTTDPGTRSGIFVGNQSNDIKIFENIIPSSSNMYGIQVTDTCIDIQLSNNDVSGQTRDISLYAASGYDGFLVQSRDGKKYKVEVNNSGQVIATVI